MYAAHEEAQHILDYAYSLNHGLWRAHSENVALAAIKISKHIGSMDCEKT